MSSLYSAHHIPFLNTFLPSLYTLTKYRPSLCTPHIFVPTSDPPPFLVILSHFPPPSFFPTPSYIPNPLLIPLLPTPNWIPYTSIPTLSLNHFPHSLQYPHTPASSTLSFPHSLPTPYTHLHPQPSPSLTPYHTLHTPASSTLSSLLTTPYTHLLPTSLLSSSPAHHPTPPDWPATPHTPASPVLALSPTLCKWAASRALACLPNMFHFHFTKYCYSLVD
ncbi:hypothetical protein Pcinc_020247 [Petrolisthes cinctipes]|uniref:Uncharacterized protein n=1 Tax=Petrolisthes cinctipes TaxID=88211 RepID=A0AAE1FIG3_PETCI|nr:hypothetical protein Pcinc_020247 [Petrolisthes cinctipes]